MTRTSLRPREHRRYSIALTTPPPPSPVAVHQRRRYTMETMTLLATVVDTSRRVGTTAARSAKIRLLADCLRALKTEELEIGVRYLSGEIRQGRIGIGPSTLRASVAEAVSVAGETSGASIHLLEVDQVLERLASTRGGGSNARRSALLRELFGRATADEQEFLLRLLVGELRQGALAGVMLAAIALATDTPPAEVRRAAMYESNLGA